MGGVDEDDLEGVVFSFWGFVVDLGLEQVGGYRMVLEAFMLAF